MQQRKFNTLLLAIFAGLALTLAIMGLSEPRRPKSGNLCLIPFRAGAIPGGAAVSGAGSRAVFSSTKNQGSIRLSHEAFVGVQKNSMFAGFGVQRFRARLWALKSSQNTVP